MRHRAATATFVVFVLGVACTPTPGDPHVELVQTSSAPGQDDGGAPVDASPPPSSETDASSPGGPDAQTPQPSPTDGVRNGTETDVDCGGTDPAIPRCNLYATCTSTADCAEGTCLGGTVRRCLRTPSCTGAAGTRSCGRNADEDCCSSLPVPSGTVQRYGIWTNTSLHTTFVSSYRLDTYEITVGRIRAFFEAMGGDLRGSAPSPGSGAHPKIAASGWRSSFDVRLPASWAEIDSRLGKAGCTIGGDNTDGGTATWTSAPGPYEDLPVTCADWYTLFAFCIWDGGRLPTDAEWLYAARGGEESRHYAWGAYEPLSWSQHRDVVVTTLFEPADGSWRFTVGAPFATTDADGRVVDGPAHIGRPGSKTGVGRWGHADLTGNVLEYMLDAAPVPEVECATDCANVSWPDPPQDQVGLVPRDWRYGDELDPNVVYPDGYRSLRGGSFDIHPLESSYYYQYRLARTYGAAGARCARD